MHIKYITTFHISNLAIMRKGALKETGDLCINSHWHPVNKDFSLQGPAACHNSGILFKKRCYFHPILGVS